MNVEAEKGVKLSPVRLYSLISIPKGLDCSSIRNGKFETHKYLIERNSDFQLHTNKETGEKLEYTVIWVSDCEYHLKRKSSDQMLKCKIVNVSIEGYECHIAQDNIAKKTFVKKCR